MDDPEFLASLRAADPDAFRRLVERESTGVYRACYRVLGHPADAEDVVQETFVTAYRSIATYRAEGSIGGWLRTIAVRLSLRRLATNPGHVVADPMMDLDLPAGEAASPVAAVLSVESQRAVREAVAALPDPYREVVVLRYFAELSMDQIARQTGRPLATCKSHLRRGLLKLRPLLERMAQG